VDCDFLSALPETKETAAGVLQRTSAAKDRTQAWLDDLKGEVVEIKATNISCAKGLENSAAQTNNVVNSGNAAVTLTCSQLTTANDEHLEVVKNSIKESALCRWWSC
jgi:hypothetical protein